MALLVAALQIQVDAHIASRTQHGVQGNNVGTEDFPLADTGGVVLLAAPVVDAVVSAVSVDAPDATTAPVTYNQAAAETAVVLANELKLDVTTLVTDVNLAITQMNALMTSLRNSAALGT